MSDKSQRRLGHEDTVSESGHLLTWTTSCTFRIEFTCALRDCAFSGRILDRTDSVKAEDTLM